MSNSRGNSVPWHSSNNRVPSDDTDLQQLSSYWGRTLDPPQTQQPSTSSFQAPTKGQLVRRRESSCSGANRPAHQNAIEEVPVVKKEIHDDECGNAQVVSQSDARSTSSSLDNAAQQQPSTSNPRQALAPLDLLILRKMLEKPSTSNALFQQIVVDEEATNQPSTSSAGSSQPPRAAVNRRAQMTHYTELAAVIQRENWDTETPICEILHSLTPASSLKYGSSSSNGSRASTPQARSRVETDARRAVADVLKALEEGRRRSETPPTAVEVTAESTPQPAQPSSSNTIPVVVLDKDATDQPSISNAGAAQPPPRTQPAQKFKTEIEKIDKEFDDRRKLILRKYRDAASKTWELEYGFPEFPADEIAVIYQMLDSSFMTYKTLVGEVPKMQGVSAKIKKDKMTEFCDEERRKENEYLWRKGGFYHTEFLRLDQGQRDQLLHKYNLTTQEGAQSLVEQTAIPTYFVRFYTILKLYKLETLQMTEVVEKYRIFEQQYIPSARNHTGMVVQTKFGDLVTLHLSRKEEENKNEVIDQNADLRMRESEEKIEISTESVRKRVRSLEAEQCFGESIDKSGQDVSVTEAAPVDVQPYTTLPSLQRLRQPPAVGPSQSLPSSFTQPPQPIRKAGRSPKNAAPTSSVAPQNPAGPSTSNSARVPTFRVPSSEDMMSDDDDAVSSYSDDEANFKKFYRRRKTIAYKINATNKRRAVKRGAGRPKKSVRVSIQPPQQPRRAAPSTGRRSMPSTSSANAAGSLNADNIRVSARIQADQWRQILTERSAPANNQQSLPATSPTVAVNRGVGRPKKNNGGRSNAAVPVPPPQPSQRRYPSRNAVSPPPFVPANAAGSSVPAAKPILRAPVTYQQRKLEEDLKVERYADPVGRAAWLAARAAAANAEPVHEGQRDEEMPRDDGMRVAERDSRKRRIEEAENEDIDEDFQPSSPKRPTKRMDDDPSTSSMAPTDDAVVRGGPRSYSRANTPAHQDPEEVPAPEEKEAPVVEETPTDKNLERSVSPASTSFQPPTDGEAARGGPRSCSRTNTPAHQNATEEVPVVKTEIHDDEYGTAQVVSQSDASPSTSGPSSSTEVRRGTGRYWADREGNTAVDFPIIMVPQRSTSARQAIMSPAQYATERAVKVEEPDELENQNEEAVVPPNEEMERVVSPNEEPTNSSNETTAPPPNEEMERAISPEPERESSTDAEAIHAVDAEEVDAPEEEPVLKEEEAAEEEKALEEEPGPQSLKLLKLFI
ncbi:hypothetical protein CRE_20865 [Caenorhabditis remanei]|uniref:Uncharacterized protein n=1 Tax=Caenorhabditis remanei TaxID=31234 RepID=E3MV03_CAERE|nr:hypothetical protein CRE_20865 [Caenorhabditis remanei]